MAFIRAACILAIALVAALFAVENMHEVAIGIFPVGSPVSLPVYLIVLGPLAVGLIAGWAIARIAGGRAHNRRLRREAMETGSRKKTAPPHGTGKNAVLPAAP
ncbi:MAG: LapA family protein [Alphaproteobacteria bacterium]|nr:LapA family protein [Alphaproteobacteria bacterium]